MMKTMQKSQLFSRTAAFRRGARCLTGDSTVGAGKFPTSKESDHGNIQQAPTMSHHNSEMPTPRRPSYKTSVAAKDRSAFNFAKVLKYGLVEGHSPMTRQYINGTSAKQEADLNPTYVAVEGEPRPISPVWLRDACPCSQCVNPSTTQKNFQSTDIPSNIKASSVESMENEDVKVTWESDVLGFKDHVSIYPKAFFEFNRSKQLQRLDRSGDTKFYPWNKPQIVTHLKFATYEQWMSNDGCFGRAILDLQDSGIFIVRGVPETETAVDDLAKRMGPIRDSFYGRTWDVKSVPDAKNVAYTQTHLGLHMDLLYMADPPGFQFLHCLQNSCKGGESIFVDAFQAAKQISDDDFAQLSNTKLAYHYRNAGEHYYHVHRVFETFSAPFKLLNGKPANIFKGRQRPHLKAINYSPPFQAPAHVPSQHSAIYARWLEPLRAFAKQIEAPENLFEYKLQPGECVVFNNRRILHGRKQFEAAGGQRWLKGAYVDTDAYESRLRTTIESGLPETSRGSTGPVFPDAFEMWDAQSPRERAMLHRQMFTDTSSV